MSDEKTCGNCKWYNTPRKYCEKCGSGVSSCEPEDYCPYWEERDMSEICGNCKWFNTPRQYCDKRGTGVSSCSSDDYCVGWEERGER